MASVVRVFPLILHGLQARQSAITVCLALSLAQVAELVDALASGASVLWDVGVQVSPWAPRLTIITFKALIWFQTKHN